MLPLSQSRSAIDHNDNIPNSIHTKLPEFTGFFGSPDPLAIYHTDPHINQVSMDQLVLKSHSSLDSHYNNYNTSKNQLNHVQYHTNQHISIYSNPKISQSHSLQLKNSYQYSNKSNPTITYTNDYTNHYNNINNSNSTNSYNEYDNEGYIDDNINIPNVSPIDSNNYISQYTKRQNLLTKKSKSKTKSKHSPASSICLSLNQSHHANSNTPISQTYKSKSYSMHKFKSKSKQYKPKSKSKSKSKPKSKSKSKSKSNTQYTKSKKYNKMKKHKSIANRSKYDKKHHYKQKRKLNHKYKCKPNHNHKYNHKHNDLIVLPMMHLKRTDTEPMEQTHLYNNINHIHTNIEPETQPVTPTVPPPYFVKRKPGNPFIKGYNPHPESSYSSESSYNEWFNNDSPVKQDMFDICFDEYNSRNKYNTYESKDKKINMGQYINEYTNQYKNNPFKKKKQMKKTNINYNNVSNEYFENYPIGFYEI